MRRFSRWMPRVDPPIHPTIRYGSVALLIIGAMWLILRYPWIPIVAVAVLGFSALADRGRLRRLRYLSSQRTGENLCMFAHAFPRGERDAWVLRAVWEEFQPYCTFRGGTMPLRPTDRLHEDLAVDPEDLECDVMTIADRAGRDLTGYESNLFYSRLRTVGDLVRFLQAQPRRITAYPALR